MQAQGSQGRRGAACIREHPSRRLDNLLIQCCWLDVHIVLTNCCYLPCERSAPKGGVAQPAYAITLAGGYKDDADSGATFWYTGEGGQEKGRQVSKSWFLLVQLVLCCGVFTVPAGCIRPRRQQRGDSPTHSGV
jgi:hypothetical protein